MSDTAVIRKQVSDLLQEHEQTLSGLADLLGMETDSLKVRNPAQMELLAENKLALAHHIEEFSEQLVRLLESRGLSANAENFSRFMADMDLADAWQRSVKLLSDCQQHNALNGGIIEATRANTDRILDILHGHNGNPRLYGASGKFDQPAGISPIAKA
jgi:flagella synthesis protein FlgN